MRRRLFNFVAAVSLVVGLAALGLWIRGTVAPVRYERRVWDETALIFRSDSVSLHGAVVRVGVVRQQLEAPPSPNVLARFLRPRPWTRLAPPATARANSPVDADFILYSFGSEVRQSSPSQVSQWALRLRLWPVAVLAAVMPGVWVGRKIRDARRLRMGHCLTCGYDVRATPDRCPECGAVPNAAHRPPRNPPMQRTATA